VVKLTVNLSDEVAAALKVMAARNDTTLTNELRKAISAWKWLDDERLKGGVLLMETDGRTRQILLGLDAADKGE